MPQGLDKYKPIDPPKDEVGKVTEGSTSSEPFDVSNLELIRTQLKEADSLLESVINELRTKK